MSLSLSRRGMFVPSDGRPKCAAPNRKAAKGHSEGVGRTQSRYLGGLCVRLARPIPSPFAKYFVLRNCRSPHPSAKGAKRLFRAISRPVYRPWIAAPTSNGLRRWGCYRPVAKPHWLACARRCPAHRTDRAKRGSRGSCPRKVLKLIRK